MSFATTAKPGFVVRRSSHGRGAIETRCNLYRRADPDLSAPIRITVWQATCQRPVTDREKKSRLVRKPRKNRTAGHDHSVKLIEL